MERRAKERLIGAGLLVVLAVIVVPELLSGPKPEPVRTEAAAQLPRPAGAPEPVRNVTVDLSTSKPPDAAAQAASAPAVPVTSPAPSSTPAAPSPPDVSSNHDASSAVKPAPQSQPAVVRSAPQSPAVAVESPAPSPRSAGAYAVQLGIFANRANAENLVHQLKAQGYAVSMSAEGSGSTARYRVRVGPLNDRDAAEKTIAKLKAAGHATTLVPPR